MEIGYQVVAEHRRNGYAEEGARALMAWAAAEHGITRFRASISPGNTPSLNLIRKLGFVQVGSQQQEMRGEELVFITTAGTCRVADSRSDGSARRAAGARDCR